MTLSRTINDQAVLPRISDYVDRFAADTPDAIAVVCSGRRVDYATLKQRVDRVSRALLAAGIQPGDRVAMLASPSLEFWELFLATAKVGAIWVGLNPRYSLPECSYILEDAKPALLVAVGDTGDSDAIARLAGLEARNPNVAIVTDIAGAGSARTIDDFLADGNDTDSSQWAEACAAVGSLDPCLIVYTSGSTGQPKGALLTHYGLSFGATMQTEHFDVARPSLVVAFPINHVASVADTCATTLVKGGKIVFLPGFDPVETVNQTEAERCTLMGGVPTMYQMQLAAPGFDMMKLASVELILWGGAAMPADIIERLMQSGKRLITAYGMTETATHITYTDPEATLDELANTVGRPDPNCEIRVRNTEGVEQGDTAAGEIQVKADFLLAGYWKRSKATRDAFTADGWFRTGDVGYFRKDGNLCLVGRLSDMYKSGGYNVYPREIENAIEAHPAVELAAVVAIPDPLYQEVGCAWVMTVDGVSLDAATLERWCRERLANYKVPKTIHIVDELPLLPVGKVDKKALKARSTS